VNIAAIAVVDAQETEGALDAEMKTERPANPDAAGVTVPHTVG
jgi:hypothetical protein